MGGRREGWQGHGRADEQLAAVHALLVKRLADTNEHIKEQNNQFLKLDQQMDLYTKLLNTAPGEQAAVTAAQDAYNKG